METMNSYLNEIISFHYIAKHKSYTQASLHLGLSKSQLSRQIHALESFMKVQLFHRSTRSVKLTEEGESLLFFSENLVKLSSETALSMRELVSEKAGLIRITAPSSLGEWFAVPVIQEFKALFPELRIEIDLNNVKRSLVDENYDFALRAVDEDDPNLITRKLGLVKDVIVASPLYLQSHPFSGELESLKDHNCLINSLKNKWTSWKLNRDGQEYNVEVQGSYASSNYSSTKILCVGGLGIAKLPYYLVKQELEQGILKILLPEFTVSTHTLYLVYPVKTYRPAKQRIFKDILLSWLESQNYAFIQEEKKDGSNGRN